MISGQNNCPAPSKQFEPPLKQSTFFPYKTQNFRHKSNHFKNIFLSPQSYKQPKTKDISLKHKNQEFNSKHTNQMVISLKRKADQIKKQKSNSSKNIFRQTFSGSKAYEQPQFFRHVRPPSSHVQNYRPSTRIRKISNIGEQSNTNFLVKYQIIRQLGKGMYGTVHLARLKQKFQNKPNTLKNDFITNPEQINQFEESKIKTEANLNTIQLEQNQQQSEQQLKTDNDVPKNQSVSQTHQIEKDQQHLVAIKVYEKFKMNKDPSKFKNIRKEITIMQNLNHVGIIKLYESVQSLTKISLVVEYGGQMSLLDYLKKHYPLSEDKVKYFARQLLQTVIYLHEKNIVHRDIKLQNILVRNNKDSGEQQIKLIDFGFSTLTNKDRKLNAICGTPNFMAPQLLNNKEYFGQKADVWSYGVVVFTIAEGRLPFKSDNYQELQILANRGRITFGKQNGKTFQNFVRSILKVKSEQRPRAVDLLKFQWLKE